MDNHDISMTEERRMIAQTAKRVGERFGLDYWRRKDARYEFPGEAWTAICDAGLCGVALPEAYGGAGLGMVEMAVAIEALAAAGAGATIAQLFMLNPIFGGVSVSKFGSEAMKQALLPKLLCGEVQFCMALTEPDAGSNTLSIRTKAKADGNGFRLDGQKIWITAVPTSQKMLVIARTRDAEEGRRRTDGITMFLIDSTREGVSHQTIEKLGTNTLPASSVFFDAVRIEPDEVVGTLNQGWGALLDVLNAERIVTTAGLIGAGKLAIRLGVDYANGRRVFGATPISAYQGLQFPLAQAYAELQCAQVMNLQAAALFDAGLPFGSESNIAKLISAQAATHATERAMQTMGGMGYAKDYHAERLWRDVRLFRFAPVSEEMILNYIAVHDLGMTRGY